MWDELGMVCDLLETVEYARPVRLDRALLDNEPAVYVWTYRGDRRGAGRRHLDLYAQHLTPTGWPVYVGSAKDVCKRRARHLRNLADTRDVSADEIEIVSVTMPSHAAALYAEGLLTDAYAPLFNQSWLRGVGSAISCGRARMSQAPSPWALLHGRAGRGTGEPTRNETQLWAMIEDHLLATVRCVRAIRQ